MTPLECDGKITKVSPVERYFQYEIGAYGRKPNWQVLRNGLVGRAWISRFSFVGSGFWRRRVFFLVEQANTKLAGGTMSVWRGTYDEDGCACTLME